MAIDRSCYAMPWFFLKDARMPPAMGAGYYGILGVDEKIEWPAPPSAPFDVIAANTRELVQELHRVAQQMALGVDNNASAIGRSGDSKKADHEGTEIVLRAYGRCLREAIEKTLDLVARARGEELTWSVSGMDTFDLADAGALTDMAVASDPLRIPSATYKRELFKALAHAQLPHLDSEVFEGALRHLPLNVARILATGERELIPRFRSSAARYAGGVADDIRRELAVGILRRESIGQMVDRLAKLGGPRGAVAVRGVAGEPGAQMEHIGEGLFKRYRYWGERVVRTETQRAYNVQIDEGLREAKEHIPDLKRRWDASLDLRICPRCSELHGAVAEIGSEFPGGYTEAPLHPQCRCRVGAWRDAWGGVIEGRTARRAVTQAAPDRDRLSPEQATTCMQEFLDRHGLEPWLQAKGVTVVPVEMIPAGSGSGVAPGKVIGGDYDLATRTIRVSTAPKTADGTFERGDFTVAQGARDQREAQQRVLAHEVGEAMFHELEQRNSPVVGQARDLRIASNQRGNPLSGYGGRTANDHFSECLVAYYFERDKLSANEISMIERAFDAVGHTYN